MEWRRKRRRRKGPVSIVMQIPLQRKKVDEKRIKKLDAKKEKQAVAGQSLQKQMTTYISLDQESGYNGRIVLGDLWGDSRDYDELTQRLHPKPDSMEAPNV